ncbi:MAG: phosphoribosylamine--glycine ligase, partial [Terriglobales bacterium]
SKSFAKEFMQRHRIPTGHYAICNSLEEVGEAMPRFAAPVVVKADGLAAGKGVVVCETKDEAVSAAAGMLTGKMVGSAGSRVVLEEYLEGDEISFLVLSDGEHIAPLVAAQDHKRIGDGDSGPNTGGMGAYSTNALLDEQMTNWLMQHIARPVVEGMKAEDAEYKGILYCGLMMTARGPMVLEFNCRFGDPETQPILMRLESDLLDSIEASIDGRVCNGEFRWSENASVCVVMSSGGYPGMFEIGKKITGIEDAEAIDGVKVFHSGTSRIGDEYYTSGGRVLGVTARAAELDSAVKRAYEAVSKISFEGAHYRKDIGARALKKS